MFLPTQPNAVIFKVEASIQVPPHMGKEEERW